MSVLDDHESGDVIPSDVMEIDGVLYLVKEQSVRRLNTTSEEVESSLWDIVREMDKQE